MDQTNGEMQQHDQRPLRHLVAGQSWYGAVVAFIGFIAAALGSLYSAEIRQTFSFEWVRILAAEHFSTSVLNHAGVIPTCWFWALAFLWLVLFTIQETAKSKGIGELQAHSRELGKQVLTMEKNISFLETSSANIEQGVHGVDARNQRIEEAVHTMPPRVFVDHFSRVCTLIHTQITTRIPRQPTSDVTIQVLEKAIRVLLSSVAWLAKIYDGRSCRYAANVMIFVARAAEEPYFPGFREEQISRFLADDFGLQNLTGILYLPQTLSAVAISDLRAQHESKEDLIDDGVEEIVFGIPKRALSSDMPPWRVLPGAPFAYSKWERLRKTSNAEIELAQVMHGIDDMEGFREFLQAERFSLEDGQIDRIKAYYVGTVPGQNVKSFRSLPLIASDTRAVGVLNVHCKEPAFLGKCSSAVEASHRQETFAAIITPLVFEIANLAVLWVKAKEQQRLTAYGQAPL